MNRRKGAWIIPTLYTVVIFSLVFGAYYAYNQSKKVDFNNPKPTNSKFVFDDKEDKDRVNPVVSSKEVMIKPYYDKNVVIGKYFYDYTKQKEEQENSIHNYDSKYFQNKGVDYSREKSFEVIAVFSGEVIKVTDDMMFGKIVEIMHDNDIVTSYSSLGEVYVEEGNKIAQGDRIGTSGENEFSSKLNNHLHFELRKGFYSLNPEEFYGKDLSEIKNN